MNWIIKRTDKMEFHTNLRSILKPIINEIKGLNWLITDLEFNNICRTEDLPVNYEQDYFILSSTQFGDLVAADMQIIWGVILGIPEACTINADQNNLPHAEGNDLIWKNGNLQHPDAIIEIVCFDSSYTILKFKDKHLSDQFKAYFNEAKDLESFTYIF